MEDLRWWIEESDNIDWNTAAAAAAAEEEEEEEEEQYEEQYEEWSVISIWNQN